MILNSFYRHEVRDLRINTLCLSKFLYEEYMSLLYANLAALAIIWNNKAIRLDDFMQFFLVKAEQHFKSIYCVFIVYH